MYVFSSSSYFEAVKRVNYLKRIADIQQKQFKLIKQSQQSIHKEISKIQTEKEKQESLLQTKIAEKDNILKDKQKKEQSLAKLKKDEAKLMAELKETERKKAELKRRIKQAIDKEIADSEAKAAKQQKKSETKNASKTSTSSGTTAKPSEKKTVVVTETKESFESNRGKLPWPVLKGTITESYGKNPHPTLANVYTNNNGIDIGAPKGAQVRAVFEGEVTSVLNIPGAGKVVIIKHGNYRTVYSNLQESFVSVGTKVSTKQAIGSLLPDEDGSLSTAHFEIHQVVDGAVNRINPTLWLAQ
jgi:septal ring factor EnvC (AmiA/AmiB activator)